VPDLDVGDGAGDDPSVQPVADGLDFWQFGH